MKMNKIQAKNLCRDVDSYGKPKSIMTKIDLIYKEFEETLEEFYDFLEFNGKGLTKEEAIRKFKEYKNN